MQQASSTLVFVAFATVALGTLAVAQPVMSYPGPFSQVEICAPVAVKVSPADPDDTRPHAVSVEAEQPVQDALKATVTPSGLLQLTSDGEFTTSQPIKVVITLPASDLQGVRANGVGDVLVAPGFKASQLLSLVSSGSASLVAKEISAPALEITTTGAGGVAVDGNIGAATVQTSGTGDVYIDGVSSDVEVQATGTGSVIVGAADPAVQIRGSTSGIGTVYYNQGECSVKSPFSQPIIPPGFMGSGMPNVASPFGNPCQQTAQISAPANNPRWTCGLEVQGKFDCSGGGFSSLSGSTSAGGGGAFMSASSTGATVGGGSAVEEPVVTAFDGVTSVTASLNGPGSVQVSSSGQGTARSISCDEALRNLRMK